MVLCDAVPRSNTKARDVEYRSGESLYLGNGVRSFELKGDLTSRACISSIWAVPYSTLSLLVIDRP